MSFDPRERLERSTPPWLFGVSLAAMAPHVLFVPHWLALSSALLVLWAFRRWQRDEPTPARGLLTLATLAALAGLAVEYRTLLGRDAGMGMLLLFCPLKLLEIRTRRDAMVLIVLAYFLLLTHFFHAQDILSAAWTFGCVALTLLAQIRLQAGQRLPLRPQLQLAGRLCLQGLPFLIVLFLLFPRIQGPLWGLPQDAFSGRTGLSDSMSPGDIATLVQSGDIALRTRFFGPVPSTAQRYWRGPVLDAFDGRVWRPTPLRTPPPRIEALGPGLDYELTLEAAPQNWLLALDAPTQLPEKSSLDGQLTARTAAPLTERTRVRLQSALIYRFNVDETPAVRMHNLQLPPRFNPRTLALAAEWQQAEQNPEALVRRALKYFTENDFHYTLEPPRLGIHSVDEFLFSTRRGFCEHYAAAFVVLMRAAGIPARVVTGYQGGELNPLDGYVVVRQSDAHAWAEVWLAGRGWVRIDPTAAVSPDRIDTGIGRALASTDGLPLVVRAEWLRDLRQRWEALNNQWNQYVLGYDEFRQRNLLATLGLETVDWQTLAIFLGGSIATLLLALLAWTLRPQRSTDPARQLWQQALRQLQRSKVDCAPWETPLCLLARVEQTAPGLAPRFSAVVDAYLAVRYGNQTDLTDLRAAVARLASRRTD